MTYMGTFLDAMFTSSVIGRQILLLLSGRFEHLPGDHLKSVMCRISLCGSLRVDSPFDIEGFGCDRLSIPLLAFSSDQAVVSEIKISICPGGSARVSIGKHHRVIKEVG